MCLCPPSDNMKCVSVPLALLLGILLVPSQQHVVHFHCRPMASCLSLTSVLFLACGSSGWPRCHLATQRHVWAAAGEGPLRLLGCHCCCTLVLSWDWAVGLGRGEAEVEEEWVEAG